MPDTITVRELDPRNLKRELMYPVVILDRPVREYRRAICTAERVLRTLVAPTLLVVEWRYEGLLVGAWVGRC